MFIFIKAHFTTLPLSVVTEGNLNKWVNGISLQTGLFKRQPSFHSGSKPNIVTFKLDFIPSVCFKSRRSWKNSILFGPKLDQDKFRRAEICPLESGIFNVISGIKQNKKKKEMFIDVFADMKYMWNKNQHLCWWD